MTTMKQLFYYLETPMIWVRTTKDSLGKCSSVTMGSMSYAANDAEGNPLPLIVMYGPETHYRMAEIAHMLRHKEIICWKDEYTMALFHGVVDMHPMFDALAADANSIDKVKLQSLFTTFGVPFRIPPDDIKFDSDPKNYSPQTMGDHLAQKEVDID